MKQYRCLNSGIFHRSLNFLHKMFLIVSQGLIAKSDMASTIVRDLIKLYVAHIFFSFFHI